VIENSDRVVDPSYGMKYDNPCDNSEDADPEFVGIAGYGGGTFQNAWSGFPNQTGFRET
jgi:hypothetical protein